MACVPGNVPGRAGCKFTTLPGKRSKKAEVRIRIHPASTTHSQLDEAAQRKAGVTPDFIRLSIGLEDADDLIDDLKRAFKIAEKAS